MWCSYDLICQALCPSWHHRPKSQANYRSISHELKCSYYIAINNRSFSISLLVTSSLNYNSSCVHFGGIQYDIIVILYLEEIYFFQLLPWKLLIFDLGILCFRLMLNFWAPCLSTARNTHLDCVRTSLNPLQLTRTAVQHSGFFPDRDVKEETALFWYCLSCIVTYCTSIQRVNHMAGVPCRDSLVIFFTEFNLLVFASLLVSLQYKFISVGKAVLNMHQGYLGHVMHVTKATGGAYIACAVCFTRVLGCTCWLDPEIMLEQWKCVHSIL